MKNKFFNTTPSLIFIVLFLFATASIVLYIPSAKGQEILCVPKTSELPRPIKNCPGENCDRMDIGAQSFWDFGQKREIRKTLDDVIKNEIPPVLTALTELRDVVRDLKSNCSYSMTPGNPTIDTSSVTCNVEIYHPIYKTDGPMGSNPPSKTIALLTDKKEVLSTTIQNPTDPKDGFEPQALDIFAKLHGVLQLSLAKIQEYENDPLKYLLSCGELLTIENRDGSKILIGNATKPVRCPPLDFISVFFLSGF